jgi:lipoate-protein ligase B
MYDESCRIYNWHIPSQQVIYIMFWIKHTYEIPKLKKKLLKTFRKFIKDTYVISTGGVLRL